MNYEPSPSPIKIFLNMFGTDTTTNFQMMRFAKELGIPNFHCIMRNELKKLKKLKKLPVYIICNYETTKEKGTHWVALYKTKTENKAFYFDSYGIEIFNEAKDFLVHGFDNRFKIQPDGSRMCGILCLYVLYSLFCGRNFFDIILEINEFSFG